MITFDTSPDRYRRWKLTVEPPIATLTLDGGGDRGASSDHELELDPCDLSLEIELYDAVQRLRFEHPEVGAVILTGSPGKGLRTGAPMRKLARSPHAATVSRAAFVNEIRCAIEDASANSGQRWLAALNATASGGDYELALAAARSSPRPPANEGIELRPLQREEFEGGFAYPDLRVELDEEVGTATLTLVGPARLECFAPEPGPPRLRALWWPLAACRQLDDALLLLRSNWPELGTLVLRTEGDPLAIASGDVAFLAGYEHDWFVREVVLYWRRTITRLELTSHSVIALIEPGSCYVGTLLELALAADRAYMLHGPAQVVLTGMNFGPLPHSNGLTRLQTRFLGRDEHVDALTRRVGDAIEAAEAAQLGLVTSALAESDWNDEVGRVIGERLTPTPPRPTTSAPSST